MNLVEINAPIGEFVRKNAEGVETDSGMYFHYQEVCSLLKKFEKSLSESDEVYGQAEGRNENRVVKITHDDDGHKKYSPKWCLVVDSGGADVTFCSGEAFGLGESIAKFQEKQGRITCPECRAKIKEIKSVKL